MDGGALISFSKLGLQKVAMDNLALFEFTVAQCSMLLYFPFVTICHNTYKYVFKSYHKISPKVVVKDYQFS